MSYGFLLTLALILLSTKVLGLLTKKFNLPQVVGALIAGLVLGPACLDFVTETEFINNLAELGVIVLMFAAGLETDLSEMKKSGKVSTVIACMGVFIPLVLGFGTAYLFKDIILTNPNETMSMEMLQLAFIGVILTATSVSITVETLKEMGKLSTAVGSAILSAAIIDDILGIIGLTLVTSLADPTVNIGSVLFKIVAFFVIAVVVGIGINKIFAKWTSNADTDKRRFVVAAFVICLIYAYVAEEFFGVADITGSFIAGLVLSNVMRREYIEHRFDTMSYLLLSPIFFASIGIKVTLGNITTELMIFTLVLTIIAVISKIIGCGLGAKICKYTNREGKLCRFTNKEALQIGAGMVSRGEVALIVADKGAKLNLVSTELFPAIVIMVVVTTVFAPILLKIVFKEKNTAHAA